MPSSSFLGQRRSSNVSGSQLLLRSLISGWQLKFIWVWLEFCLIRTGWRMEFTFPTMDYHLLPTLARLAFRRSAASSNFLHTIPQLKLLKDHLIGNQRCIFYWSSCSCCCSSAEYMAGILLLIKPWFYSQADLFTFQRCQTSQLVKNIRLSAWQTRARSENSTNYQMQLEGILLMQNPIR